MLKSLTLQLGITLFCGIHSCKVYILVPLAYLHFVFHFSQPGELNYVDVEFTKPKKKKKKSKKEKEQDSSDIPQPSVEYSEVIVKKSTPSLK